MINSNITPIRKNNPKKVLLALSWYSHEIHRGVARYAKQAGWRLDRSVHRNTDIPEKWTGDGIICSINPTSKIKSLIANSKVPAINMGWYHPELGLSTVIHDDVEIGKQAADHFVQREFKEFAFYLKHPSDLAKNRMEGFKQGAISQGNNFFILDWTTAKESITNNPHSKINRHQWLVTQLLRLPKPLAIMTENDDHALELIDACMEANISVPEQVAIIGCDNDELDCTVSPIPLSSVDADLEGLGYKAAELLDKVISEGETPPACTKIPPKGVIARQSSDIKAIPHPEVATALCFIWNNFQKPIQVDDVVRAVSMSRRGLYDAFTKFVGRSIAEEITRLRLKKAAELLIATNKKASEIAEISGFASSDRMGKVFMRIFKMSPSAYRKSNGEISPELAEKLS